MTTNTVLDEYAAPGASVSHRLRVYVDTNRTLAGLRLVAEAGGRCVA